MRPMRPMRPVATPRAPVRALLLTAVVAAGGGCRRSPEMSPGPSNPLDPADARRDLESAADLGPGLAPATFAPGRYATAIQRSLAGTHELQLVREASTASLALELDADGAARARAHGARSRAHSAAKTSRPSGASART